MFLTIFRTVEREYRKHLGHSNSLLRFRLIMIVIGEEMHLAGKVRPLAWSCHNGSGVHYIHRPRTPNPIVLARNSESRASFSPPIMGLVFETFIYIYSQGPVLYTPPVLYTLQCKVPQESSSCKILLTYIITMYRLILLWISVHSSVLCMS